MTRSEDDRCVRPQEGFNVNFIAASSLSCHESCQREEVQRAAMKTIPHERPRPGRRRLSMLRLPLNLTQIFLFATMILSVLCQPVDAVEHPASQSRAVEARSVDGRIMLDQDAVPRPELQRREGSSTSTATLPRAFDSGFGTNYTQPSCPTFLRSMVNNETFISCVPFSLLLQVCHPSRASRDSFKPCLQRTDLLTSRTPCPSSTPAAPSPPSPPS